MNKSSEDEKLWSEFRQYFDAFVVGDIEKALNAGLEVGVIILTAIGIDCLSGYYTGKPTDRDAFGEFVKEYMPSDYAAFADDIFGCIRNGLAHDYVIKRNSLTNRTFDFSRDEGEPHLVPSTSDPDKITLNRATFARDFLNAQHEYFESVEREQTVWDNAMRRLKSERGFLAVTPQTIARLSGATTSTPPPSASEYLSTGVKKTRP